MSVHSTASARTVTTSIPILASASAHPKQSVTLHAYSIKRHALAGARLIYAASLLSLLIKGPASVAVLIVTVIAPMVRCTVTRNVGASVRGRLIATHRKFLTMISVGVSVVTGNRARPRSCITKQSATVSVRPLAAPPLRESTKRTVSVLVLVRSRAIVHRYSVKRLVNVFVLHTLDTVLLVKYSMTTLASVRVQTYSVHCLRGKIHIRAPVSVQTP